MKKRSLLALSCLAALNISHAAPMYDHSGKFYLPISIGVMSPSSASNHNNGIAGGLGVGYNVDNYFSAQLNAFGFENARTNDENTDDYGYFVDAEGHFNLANQSPVTPYALIGAGEAKVGKAGFAWDYGAGLNASISPTLSFDASWRQVRQNSPHQIHNMYLGGIVWTFGAAPAPVAAPVPAPAPAPQPSMMSQAQSMFKFLMPGGVPRCQGNEVSPTETGCVTFENNQMIMHLNVKFKFGKAGIQDQYGVPINSLGNFMSAYPDTTVTLEGYASNEGKKYQAAYNKKLSAHRAVAVKNYLVNKSGIATSRITTVGMGTEPVSMNKTAADRAANRRVEAVIPVEAQLVPATAPGIPANAPATAPVPANVPANGPAPANWAANSNM